MNYKILGKLVYNKKKDINPELRSKISALIDENERTEQKINIIRKAKADLKLFDRKELKRRKAVVRNQEEVDFIDSQIKESYAKRKAAKAILRQYKKENPETLEQIINANLNKLDTLFEEFGKDAEQMPEILISDEEPELEEALKELKVSNKLAKQYYEQMEILVRQRDKINEQINKLSDKIKALPKVNN